MHSWRWKSARLCCAPPWGNNKQPGLSHDRIKAMNISHPLEHLPQRKHWFLALLALALLIMLAMNFIGLPLNTTAAPSGIVSFEFAASPENAQAMLNSWGEQGRVNAAFIQGLDFLFPAVYSTMLALACLMSASTLGNMGWPLARLGAGLAWGQWAAALFDYIENLSLVALLLGPVAAPWPQIAAICAAIKFALLLAGIAYGFFGLAARLSRAVQR